MLLSTVRARTVRAPRPSQPCGNVAYCDDDQGFFCCGSCKNPFCCNDITLKINANDCEDAEGNKNTGPSAQMLGAILGGMAGSFCCAFLAQAIVRRLSAKLRKWRRARAENSEDSSTVPVPPSITARDRAQPPPVYEDVHLYRTLGQEANGDKPNYHWVADSTGVFSVLEAKVETPTESTPDGSPPPYASVFPKDPTEKRARPSVVTISERMPEQSPAPPTQDANVSFHADTETSRTASTRPKRSRPFFHAIFAGPGCF